MADPVISIMILTQNRIGAVMRCVQDVVGAARTWKPGVVEILILDQGSRDGTASWLRRVVDKQPELPIKLILEDENLGVAGGRQKLLDIAQGQDDLVFLDSDISFSSPDALYHLARAAYLDKALSWVVDGHDPIGVIGPGGHSITPGWKWFEPVPDEYEGAVDVVSGYCQYFTRGLIEKGVRLDQAYNPYWIEDSDFCLQAKAAGYSIWQTPLPEIRHHYAGTGDDGSGRDKMRYLASKWAGKGLVRFEKKAITV